MGARHSKEARCLPIGTRVSLIVVGDPGWQLAQYGFDIRSRTDTGVVTFDGADEDFSHSIALRAFDRRCSTFKPDVPSEATGITSDAAAAIIGQPFDRNGQAIDPAEPMFDGSYHQVAHVAAGDAARGGQEAHGFPITAVQCEGNPHSLAVFAADLEAIEALAPIAFIYRDAAVMPPLATACVAIEQQAMDLHHPVDPLVIGWL